MPPKALPKQAIIDEVGLDPQVSPRILKVLDVAEAEGWMLNPFVSLAVRLTRDDAEPFYAVWHLVPSDSKAGRSWKFAKAYAKNGQPLAYEDILIYLKDPSVIYPEPPDEDDEIAAMYAAWEASQGEATTGT